MSKNDKPKDRTLLFQVAVTVPAKVTNRRAGELLGQIINAGLGDAADSTDLLDSPAWVEEAEEALSLEIAEPQMQARPNEIIVVIEGGCLTGVFAKDPAVQIQLLDYDNMKEEPPRSRARRAMQALEARIKAMKAVF